MASSSRRESCPTDGDAAPALSRLGGEAEESFDGKLVPWEDDDAVMFTVPGQDICLLPCFSSEELLVSFMASLAMTYESIKTITYGQGFLEALPAEVNGVKLNVIIDPFFGEDGVIHFKMLQREPMQPIDFALRQPGDG